MGVRNENQRKQMDKHTNTATQMQNDIRHTCMRAAQQSPVDRCELLNLWFDLKLYADILIDLIRLLKMYNFYMVRGASGVWACVPLADAADYDRMQRNKAPIVPWTLIN